MKFDIEWMHIVVVGILILLLPAILLASIVNNLVEAYG